MKMEAQHTKAFILWCLVKAVLRGKIIVINTYITKKNKTKLSLPLYFKELERE